MDKLTAKRNDKELIKEMKDQEGNLKKEHNKQHRVITIAESTIKDLTTEQELCEGQIISILTEKREKDKAIADFEYHIS